MVVLPEPAAVPVVELSKDSQGGYKLNENELENILLNKDYSNKKVALISVAGAYRKGKSFLLNFFVQYLDWLESGGEGAWFDEKTVLDKFQWKGGTKRNTHGIIMWNKPYVLKDHNGEEIVVLLMDTQGTFDHQSTVRECATIFAMSTMLSSVQQIQEDDLQNLQLFTQYAKLAQKCTKTAPFQKLLFLVRDWPNSEEHEYGYGGGDDYLGEVLKVTRDQERELQALRRNLHKSFAEMRAFLMPHPGLRIAKNNSDLTLGAIEEDFKEQIDVFVTSMFDKKEIEAKRVAGKDITCGELFHFFKAYMKIFNSDALPKPKSIFEATAQASVLAAEETARTEYDREINDFMDSNPNLFNVSMLQNAHETAKQLAFIIFDSKPTLGCEEISATYKTRLSCGIEKRYLELKEQVAERQLTEERKIQIEGDKLKLEEERNANEAKVATERREIAREMEKERQEMDKEQKRRDAENKRKEELFQKKEKEALEELRKRQQLIDSKEKDLKDRQNRESREDLLNAIGTGLKVLGQVGAGFVQGLGSGGNSETRQAERPRSFSTDFEPRNGFGSSLRNGPDTNSRSQMGESEKRIRDPPEMWVRPSLSPFGMPSPPTSASGIRPPLPYGGSLDGGMGPRLRAQVTPPSEYSRFSSSSFPVRPAATPGSRLPPHPSPYHANMGKPR